jgi:hypothetical protein
MNKRFFASLAICVILSSLLLCSCNSTASQTPTLTFDAGKCTYTGPKTVPATFTLNWVINDEDHPGYVYAILTLLEGKTVDDLVGWSSTEKPSWVNRISWNMEPLGGNYAKEHNLYENALYKGEPIYIICYYDGDNLGKNIGAVGPIKVKN